MSEMVERVARALAHEDHPCWSLVAEVMADTTPDLGDGISPREHYMLRARAAIAAMREPTEAVRQWVGMAEVGSVWVADFGNGRDEPVTFPIAVALMNTGIRDIDAALLDAWRNMIDAALKDTANG